MQSSSAQKMCKRSHVLKNILGQVETDGRRLLIIGPQISRCREQNLASSCVHAAFLERLPPNFSLQVRLPHQSSRHYTLLYLS